MQGLCKDDGAVLYVLQPSGRLALEDMKVVVPSHDEGFVEMTVNGGRPSSPALGTLWYLERGSSIVRSRGGRASCPFAGLPLWSRPREVPSHGFPRRLQNM